MMKKAVRWRQTKLSKHIKQQRWDRVIERLKSHPEEASKPREVREAGQSYLQYPLEEAFSSKDGILPPISVVKALLQIYPAAAPIASCSDGRTTLHQLCLREMCGPGHIPMSNNNTTRTIDYIKALLRHHPKGGLVRDAAGQTPLEALFRTHAMEIAEAEIMALREAKNLNTSSSGSVLVKHANLRLDSKSKWWEELTLILRASYHGSMEVVDSMIVDPSGVHRSRKWRVVHACAALSECPTPLLRLALYIHPQQAHERDEDGNNPLHLALKCRRADDGTHNLSHIVRAILSCDPQSASITDDEGRLPMALAIESFASWKKDGDDGGGGGCLNMIFDAYPRALYVRDATSRLYPFMLAAACCCSLDDDDGEGGQLSSTAEEARQAETRSLTTVFEIILADPAFLSGFVSD